MATRNSTSRPGAQEHLHTHQNIVSLVAYRERRAVTTAPSHAEEPFLRTTPERLADLFSKVDGGGQIDAKELAKHADNARPMIISCLLMCMRIATLIPSVEG